jgi:hypothetical protein
MDAVPQRDFHPPAKVHLGSFVRIVGVHERRENDSQQQHCGSLDGAREKDLDR